MPLDTIPPGAACPAAPGDPPNRPTPNPVFYVALSVLVITEEEDPATRKGFRELRLSVKQAGGNVVPIFVGPTDCQGKRPVYDGNGRVRALGLEGFEKASAIEVPEGLDELGLIEFAATHNGIRRTLSPEEWAVKAERIMELVGCTQEEAARRLHRSPASLSRDLAALQLPEKHREKGGSLFGSVRSLIAAIRDPLLQDEAVAFMTSGVSRSRAELELWLKGRKSPKGKGRPAGEIKDRGPIARMKFAPKADHEAIVRELKYVVETFEGNKDLPVGVVISILNGRASRPETSAKSGRGGHRPLPPAPSA